MALNQTSVGCNPGDCLVPRGGRQLVYAPGIHSEGEAFPHRNNILSHAKIRNGLRLEEPSTSEKDDPAVSYRFEALSNGG